MDRKQYRMILAYSDALRTANPNLNNKAEIQVLRADAFYYENDLENSLDAYFAALQSIEQSEIGYTSLEQEVHSHIGFCYRELGLSDKALPHYLKSKEIAKQMEDSTELAIQSYNLGTVYYKLGQLKEAVTMLSEAYTIDLAKKDTSALGFDLSLMTDLQLKTGNLEQALAYSKESLLWLRAEGANANSLGTRLSKIGDVFFLKKELDSADFYLNKAKSEYEKVGDSLRLATLWITQAKVEIERKNYKRAVTLAFKAKRWHLKNGYNGQVSNANLTMIKALLSSKKLEEAENVINENISGANELGLLDDLKETYFLQSEFFDRQGRYKESKMSLIKFQTLKDSLLSIDEKERIKHLELTFKFDKIEHENEVLRLNHEISQAQIEKDKLQIMWLIISLVITLIGAALIIWLMYTKYKLKKQLLMSEINELRVQIKSLLAGDTSELGLDAVRLNNGLKEPLSEREFEILKHAVSDLSNSQIGEKVFVSVNTVKFHLKNIYNKLGVSNRKQALEYLIKTK